MYPIKRVIVGLDLSEMDPTLIKFVSFVAKASSTEKIYFVNIIKDFNLPDDIKKEFPGLKEHAVKEREDKMRKMVDEYLDPELGIDFSIIIKNGQKAKKLLKLSKDKSVDMVIIGRKNELKGSGVLAQRLARRLECSLLIVPESSEPKIEKLLVPIDFSGYSEIALEEAITISVKRGKNIEIICQNVYHVPAGYHYTGKSYEEFAAIMEENTRGDYNNFIKKIDTKGVKITPVYSLDSNDDPIEDIFEMAKNINADGLVIGVRGRTSTTALFLSSMAERLIQQSFQIPLLIVRPKGKNAGIIDYLREEV